jgi:hypothetical protein
VKEFSAYSINGSRCSVPPLLSNVNLIINTPLSYESFFDEIRFAAPPSVIEFHVSPPLPARPQPFSGIRSLQTESLGVCSQQEYLGK